MGRRRTAVAVDRTVGKRGCPRLRVSPKRLQDLIEMDLSVPCIAKLLGVSVQTVRRRMQEWGLSIKDTYSSITDTELDSLVSKIKQDSKNLGYRMVKGRLRAQGHRVQWNRVFDSMHRVDSHGVLERMTSFVPVEKRIHSVSGPLSVLHIDNNHKLIRYGMVMFGGIDGFSRKILYLQIANNNKVSTALEFFLEAVAKHGFSSRVKWDIANIARCMFEVRGCGRGSFVSGKSVHKQRTDETWHDVWKVVSDVYYDLLHGLEEDRLLDATNHTHLFCAQYVFLPRIKADLDTFTERWNNHSPQTERKNTPNQLWESSKTQSSVTPPENTGGQFPDVKILDMDSGGIQVPEVVSPLDNEELETLTQLFNPIAPSSCFGADIYCSVVRYVEDVVESRQES